MFLAAYQDCGIEPRHTRRPASGTRSASGSTGYVLNRIVWKFRTGTAWRDVPQRFGPWATLHTRFRR
uniref:transposase n=1 Tax=Streptomyces mirabilis TaxID=68239 RepID=UPI00167E6B82